MNMHTGFAEVDLDPLDLSLDEEAPETIPTAGSANLIIEDKCEALFFSAEWTVVARVNGKELARSMAQDHTHTVPFVQRWARQMIRTNKARLRRLGVDVEATYIKWGGILEDLSD